MKQFGVNCSVDELGRLVIPKEIRDYLRMTDGVDKFEFSIEGEQIVLTKFEPTGQAADVGIPRTIDRQGRVVIPKGIRKTFNIRDNADDLDLFMDKDRIVIRKHTAGCIFCGKPGTFLFKEKAICTACARALRDTLTKRAKG